MTIGIIGAMPQEVDSIIDLLDTHETIEIGGKVFHTGTFKNHNIVVVFSKWGKVSAASCAATLMSQFRISKLIFTGVAGAVCTQLSIGDIVVGDKCLQHDMDARPFFPKYQIPLTDTTFHISSNALVDAASRAITLFFENDFFQIPEETKNMFQIKTPKIHIGTIASGDQFVSCEKKLEELRNEGIAAVEMEGAAVSQVCSEFAVDFVVIRTISDKANTNAPIDFPAFLAHVTPIYAKGIIKHLLSILP